MASWPRGRGGRLAVALVVVTALKEVQKWALHGARLFDAIGTLEAFDLVWRRLTGR